MNKLSDKYVDPGYKAQLWYKRFKNLIEESKKKVIESRKLYNAELALNQVGKYTNVKYDGTNEICKTTPFRKKDKPFDVSDNFIIFVRNTGYQVIPMEEFIKLSKGTVTKLYKNYLRY